MKIIRDKSIWLFSFMFIVLIILVCFSGFNGVENNDFSIEQWNNSPYDRINMIYSLFNQYDIVGMERGEVIDLLGTNDMNMTEDEFSYTLGGEFFMRYLVLVFDNAGKVQQYYVYSD